jgi:hypothetical protein
MGDPGKQSFEVPGARVTSVAEKDPQRLQAQGNVLLAKLKALGDGGSLHLGPEAADVVLWLLKEGLVEVENLGGDHFVIRDPTP